MPLSQNEWAILRQRIQDALGGGAAISAANPLPVTAIETLVQGIATGGTNTTLIDATKGWQVNIWEDAQLDVTVAATGITYTREIDNNNPTTLDFTTNPLPGVIVVAAGDVYRISRIVSPLNPLARANLFNVIGYLTPNDILGAALAPLNSPCTFRVEATFTTGGILSATITQGGVTIVSQFNGGVALNVNSAYRFSMMVNAGDTINFRYSVNSNILSLKVIEVIAAAE